MINLAISIVRILINRCEASHLSVEVHITFFTQIPHKGLAFLHEDTSLTEVQSDLKSSIIYDSENLSDKISRFLPQLIHQS